MLDKVFDQMSTELEAHVPPEEPDRWLRLADTVAARCGPKPYSIHPTDGGTSGLCRTFTIAKRGRRVSSFEVSVSGASTTLGPAGTRTIWADLDEATVKGAWPERGSGNTLGVLWASQRGIPGYGAYLGFLRDFESAIVTEAGGQAVIHLRTTDDEWQRRHASGNQTVRR